MTFQEIIKLHPQPTSLDRDALLRCIEECLDCAASCTACADASLSEGDVQELVRVIRLCLDCADACDATGRIVTRQSAPDFRLLAAMLEACSAACLASAEECELHAAHHEHCRVCAEVCRRCKKTCDDLLATIVLDTTVTERGITLTFASGARVDLLDEEAAWLREELVRGEYTSPKRDAGTVVDRALGAIDEDTEPSPADMTPANVVELAWALRGMLDHDSDRFIGSPLLMHLRDLLFIELERGRQEELVHRK